jgi:hypothetical protein
MNKTPLSLIFMANTPRLVCLIIKRMKSKSGVEIDAELFLIFRCDEVTKYCERKVTPENE